MILHTIILVQFMASALYVIRLERIRKEEKGN